MLLKNKIDALEKSLKESHESNRLLNLKVNMRELPITVQVKSSDSLCNHYTAFPSLARLYTVFEFIDPGVNGENVILYQNQENKATGHGRK